MKKSKLLIAVLLVLSTLLPVFSSCGECEHVWEEKGYVAKEPTDKEVGYRMYTCLLCGTKKSEEIPMLSHMDHVYTNLQWGGDSTHHWLCCEFKDCTATTNKSPHRYTDSKNGTHICDICRLESAEHTFTDAVRYDEQTHWIICDDKACPTTAYRAPHTVQNGKCTGCDYTPQNSN